jgi:hypothetical protein
MLCITIHTALYTHLLALSNSMRRQPPIQTATARTIARNARPNNH